MNLHIRNGCINMWNLLDPIYFHCTRLHYVKNKFGSHTIMRVRLTKYKGKKLTLSDGTVIKKDDILLKIHLHNVKLLRHLQSYESDIRKALITYRSVQDSLPLIVDYIQSNGYESRIKGLIGITSLHKGCQKLGFEIFPIYNSFYKLYKKATFCPIHLLSSANLKKKMPSPMYLIMSKEELFKKY